MKRPFIFLVLLFLTLACTEKRYIDLVDPFIGTDFHGHTYPGATVPFGAVQLSPDTRRGNWDACSGYHYSDSTLFGFSHTHLSGTGCIDLGDILIHPTVVELKNANEEGYIFDPIPFSHDNEIASPGYYSVLLKQTGIKVELTASKYSGVHRYTFPKSVRSKLIVDLGHRLDNEKIIESSFAKVSSTELVGMRRTQGWAEDQHIYFYIQFSKPFETLTYVKDGESKQVESISEGNLQAIPVFSTKEGEQITLKVGISFVSIENARDNLFHDVGNKDFDQVKQLAEQTWEEHLSKIKIQGGTKEQQRIFYTALYHSMVVPNINSDANGQYRGYNQGIHSANPFAYYSTFSLWDTFRAWNPLMTLIDTSLVKNIVFSCLQMYKQSGELPIWPLTSNETGTMIGYHSVSVIADAYLRGICTDEPELALEAMIASSNATRKSTNIYATLGYIPSDSKKESVSCLLENAYDDWCIALFAKKLGKEDVFEKYIRRSKSYINVFDGNTCFFRPKQKNGNWEPQFNPFEVGRAYTEATAWQYRFFVPHDINGLAQQFGGTQNLIKALDSLFSVPSDLGGGLVDITGLIGQYAHGNEPSHHMAYLYSYLGEPWKTQAMVRRLLNEMYNDTPSGIIGNEDCGQMSAWYILSSLGIYPVCPGSGQYVLTSPLFEKAEITLANGKILTIVANQAEKKQYIQSVKFNNEEIKENYINFDELFEGGTLVFELGGHPNKERGIKESETPYSLTQHKEVSNPYIVEDLYLFENETKVTMGCTTPSSTIYYTLDGTNPTIQSIKYTSPFSITESVPIRMYAIAEGFENSQVVSIQSKKADFRPAIGNNLTHHGVSYKYFEGKFSKTDDLLTQKAVETGILPEPSIGGAKTEDYFGFLFEGYIRVPETGIYEFTTRSDDGSVLYIGTEKVVDNDGSHGAINANGRIALKQGFHPFRLLYFEDYEGQDFDWKWRKYGSDQFHKIDPNVLFYK